MVLMNHNYTKGMMINLGVSFLILPVIFVVLRLWAKTLSAKRFAWDDYLTISALLVSITCCALQISTAIHGHLGSHQPQFPNGDPIMDDKGLIFFEQTKFALNCISILGLGLVKSSILVLYKNIFRVRKFQILIYICLAYVIGWTVSFFFSHLFTCYPITVFIEPYYGNRCVQTVPMFLSLLYTDVVADVVILFLPVPMIIGVQLPLKRKLAVTAMLMLGAAVCAISITRVIATYAIAEEYIKHPNDVIYYTAPVFFWTNIELSLAIVCACLPTLRPIWLHFFPKVTTTQYHSSYESSRLTNTKNSSLGPKFARNPYEAIEEFELGEHPEHTRDPNGRQIMRQITIRQKTTTDVAPESGLNTASSGGRVPNL